MSLFLKTEVEKFRAWAKEEYPENDRGGEWECDYLGWSELYAAFEDFIANANSSEISANEIADLIYVIARDNESEYLIEEVAERKELFKLLLSHSILSNESDAKWQFANVLGSGNFGKDFAEKALLKLVYDTDEYTSRMALQALGKIKSVHAEELCKRAWNSNHEYQRIVVLWVLYEIESGELSKYIKLAQLDGRKYLVQNAIKVSNLKDRHPPSKDLDR